MPPRHSAREKRCTQNPQDRRNDGPKNLVVDNKLGLYLLITDLWRGSRRDPHFHYREWVKCCTWYKTVDDHHRKMEVARFCDRQRIHRWPGNFCRPRRIATCS